jgi:pimeloyl-ACP methyl ester carboxylesterase
MGPVMFAGIDLHYDPMPVLRRLNVPQLWILAADDIDAPPAETLRRLKSLKAEGKPVTVVVYPRTEHGLYEYEVDAAGERLSTRQPATYLPLMQDFIRGKLQSKDSDSEIHR